MEDGVVNVGGAEVEAEQRPPLTGPLTGHEASPHWSTTGVRTGVQKSASNLQGQSYVSFESEPARGWLSRNATVPGNPGVLTLSLHQ